MDLCETPKGSFARHPWESTRAAFFRRVLAPTLSLADPPGRSWRVLDVGAGDAWFASTLLPILTPGSRITCWDTGYAEKTPPLPASDSLVLTGERPSGPFDLMLMLDVAEHVADDHAFVRGVTQELLGPAGVLLFSVPAWPQLMSAHDVALHHYRRYTPGQARDLLLGAGLRIEQSGGLFHSLVAPRALAALRERWVQHPPTGTASLEWRGSSIVRQLVELALRADNELSWATARAGLELPGLTWWALCRRS